MIFPLTATKNIISLPLSRLLKNKDSLNPTVTFSYKSLIFVFKDILHAGPYKSGTLTTFLGVIH